MEFINLWSMLLISISCLTVYLISTFAIYLLEYLILKTRKEIKRLECEDRQKNK